MQLAQERQPGCGLAFEQHHDQRKFSSRIGPFVERLVVFGHLPFADAFGADQKDEGGRLGDFPRELLRPGAAGPQMRGCEEDARGRILALDSGLETLRQSLIRRMVAEKPALHSTHRGRAATRIVFQGYAAAPATRGIRRRDAEARNA